MIYVSREEALLKDEESRLELQALIRSRWISFTINAGALFLAFIAPYVAVALYFVQALLLLVLPIIAYRAKQSTKAKA